MKTAEKPQTLAIAVKRSSIVAFAEQQSLFHPRLSDGLFSKLFS